MDDATRPDQDRRRLDDAIRIERMALDSGPNADKNLSALAREISAHAAASGEDSEPSLTVSVTFRSGGQLLCSATLPP